MSSDSILHQLMQTIESRRGESAEKSYTAKLLAGGLEKIAGKIREESGELIEAADEPGEEGRQHFICEAGDVIYHLLVMLAAKEVSLGDVEIELARRFGMSGLEEKASRDNKE